MSSYGYIVIDSKFTRYAMRVDIPASLETRKEAIAYLDGYGRAVAKERKCRYLMHQTTINFESFDTETERINHETVTDNL